MFHEDYKIQEIQDWRFKLLSLKVCGFVFWFEQSPQGEIETPIFLVRYQLWVDRPNQGSFRRPAALSTRHERSLFILKLIS